MKSTTVNAVMKDLEERIVSLEALLKAMKRVYGVEALEEEFREVQQEVPVNGSKSLTLREAILKVMRPRQEYDAASVMANIANELGMSVKKQSVCALLSKEMHDGNVERVDKGRYMKKGGRA